MRQWKTVELIADYWIIIDQEYNEYVDERGDNLMFYRKQDALKFIKQVQERA